MATTIDALYIFSESDRHSLLLSHIWSGRPPSAQVLLPLYLEHPTPRPSLIYVSSTNPPTLIHIIVQDRLLFLAPTSTDSDPLAIITFLHRVADALEDVLGSPLLPTKISSSHDALLQILTEMCDAGIINTTEPNALRDLVESPSWVNRLLGTTSSSILTTPVPSALSLSSGSSKDSSPAIPWRRSNVKHTSNELYVDIVESLQVIMAPSGLPLVARASGTIVFTAKVSGVPELLLILGTPSGGSMGVSRIVNLPTFHPCVRLNRWRDRPGELSFVPPDGRFVLCGYDVDLLGNDYYENLSGNTKSKLVIPASVSIIPSTTTSGHGSFTVELTVHHSFCSPVQPASNSGIIAAAAAARTQGTSAHPTLEEVTVRVPIPSGVRTLPLLKPSRGEARWAPGDEYLVWKLRSKDINALGTGVKISGTGGIARLKVETLGEDLEEKDNVTMTGKYEYDEDEKTEKEEENPKTIKVTGSSANLMPSGATVSFTVRGWLASGLKVEKLALDAQRSRGLGAGVTPYKGVKYVTVSQDGVETRA